MEPPYRVCIVGPKEKLFAKRFFDTVDMSENKKLLGIPRVIENEDSKYEAELTYIYHEDFYSDLYEKWISRGECYIFILNVRDGHYFDKFPSFKNRLVDMKNTKSIPAILVSLNVESSGERKISYDDAKKLAFTLRAPYKEVSIESLESELLYHKIVEVLNMVVKEANFYRQLDELYVGDKALKDSPRTMMPSKLKKSKSSEFAQKMHSEVERILSEISHKADFVQRMQKSTSQRDKIVIEILNSECAYCSSLNFAVQEFLEPLRQSAAGSPSPILAPSYIPKIFLNLEQVLSENIKFLQTLAKRVLNDWSTTPRIGDVFLTLVPLFDVYAEYVKHHFSAIEVEKSAERKYPMFFRFVQNQRERSESKLDILSYLIQPVQRLPRYELFLKKLIEHTEETESDTKLLKQALKILTTSTADLNKTIAFQEAWQKIISLERSFLGQVKLVEPDRKLLKDGPLLKLSKRGVRKRRWFFLFNDAIAYAEIVSSPIMSVLDTGKAPYNGHMYILCRLLKWEHTLKVYNLKDIDAFESAFQFITTTKSFTVVAEKPDDKILWLIHLENLLGATKVTDPPPEWETTLGGEIDGAAPLWISDKNTDKCMLCAAEFTVIKRRHHCRNCGKVCCSSCCSNQLVLPHLKTDQTARVCTECFVKIRRKGDSDSGDVSGVFINGDDAGSTTGEPPKSWNKFKSYFRLSMSQTNTDLEEANSNSNSNSNGSSSVSGSGNNIGSSLPSGDAPARRQRSHTLTNMPAVLRSTSAPPRSIDPQMLEELNASKSYASTSQITLSARPSTPTKSRPTIFGKIALSRSTSPKSPISSSPQGRKNLIVGGEFPDISGCLPIGK